MQSAFARKYTLTCKFGKVAKISAGKCSKTVVIVYGGQVSLKMKGPGQRYPLSRQKSDFVFHCDLAHFHGGQRIQMALRRDAGTAGSIHSDGHFR